MSENIVELNKICDFVNDKVLVSMLTLENYISTENMLSNKSGVVLASNLPNIKYVSMYRPGDILISNIRPYFKKIWHANNTGGVSNDVLIFRAKEGYKTKFLYYLLADDNFFEFSTKSSKGTKMPRGDKDAIMQYMVPDLEEPQQEKIIGVLSRYDDLIENNTRRISILEEMAQKLYREWFVHLRFPGYENANMVESELGLIPEGWEVSTIEANTTLLRRGITPKYDDAASKTVVNQKCVRNFSVDIGAARQQSKDYPVELNLQYGDILINSTGAGTLGRVGQFFDNVVNTTVDSHVTIVRPQKNCICYLGLILKSLQSELMDMGVGSTNQTELNRDLIKCIRVVLPTDEVLNTFERAINNWMTLKRQLVSQNINLRKTRDLLLPRLISGDIDVSELDIPIKEG